MKPTPVYRVVITAVFALALLGQVAAPTPLQAAPPAPTTLTPDGMLQLPIGEVFIQSSVIDNQRGFAYFITMTGASGNYQLPTLVKVRLAGFARVNSFVLPIDPVRVSSAMLDETTGMLYFGTVDGHIHKVNTLTFQYVGALTTGPDFDPLVALLDSAGGYAYFGGDTGGTIIRVRLSDFSLAGVLTLKPGEGVLESGALDLVHGDAYFVAPPRQIVKVRLADFTRVDRLLAYHALYDSASIVDSTGTYAYFSGDRNSNGLVRVRLKDFTITGELNDGGRFAVLRESEDTGYFITSDGRTSQIRLSDFTLMGGILLDYPRSAISSMLVDEARDFIYISAGEENSAGFAQVTRFSLPNLTNTGVLDFEKPERGLTSVVYDPRSNFAYYGTCSRPYQLIRVNVSTLTRVDTMPLPDGYGCATAGALDHATGYAYFAMSRGILKVRLSDFTLTAYIPYPFALASIVLDPLHDYAYFGTSDYLAYAPAVIAIRLSTFTEARTLPRNGVQVPGSLTTALIDPQSTYGYFLDQGHVWRVDLKTFLPAGSLTLPNWTWISYPTGLLSPDGTYLYVSGTAGTGKIERVRLSDFSLDGSLALGTTVGGVIGSTYDPASNRAYFSTASGQLFAVNLTDFTVADSLTLGPGFWTLVWAAPRGPMPGYLYLGTYGEAGQIWRVRVEQVGPPTSLKAHTR